VPTKGPSLIRRAREAIDVLIREMLKFGVVGAVAFVIDLGGYNLLVYGPHLQGVLDIHDKPVTAKIVSASLATLVAWLGNRMWTFRHRRNRQVSHELALFVFFNGVAMVIAVICLGTSRYVFDLHTQFTDNIANILGIGLGTLFRFWSYRKFVFAGILNDSSEEPSGLEPAKLEPRGL